MTIEFEAERVRLNFANNAGSNVNANTCSVVYNADKSKFKIVGPVPKIENGTVTNLSDLIATSGAEFYYFCTNSAVTSTTIVDLTHDFIDPLEVYFTSSSDTSKESWYDAPTSILQLYSCFLTPIETQESNGANRIRVYSNSVTTSDYSAIANASSCTVLPQSISSVNWYAGEISSNLTNSGIFVFPFIKSVALPLETSYGPFYSRYANKSTKIYYNGTITGFKDLTAYGTERDAFHGGGGTMSSGYGKVGNPILVITNDCRQGENFYCTTFYCLSLDTEITCYDEKRKRWYKKKLRDLTYRDKIVVWNFDEGKFDTAEPIFLTKEQVATRYTVVKLSDGAELKLIGENDSKRHRMFVKETGRFDYVNKSLIGKTTFNEKGENVKILSVEYIDGEIEFANIITKHHFNCFANGILTSCRLSNMYKIEDMKYIKDNRKLRPISDFEGVEEKYYDGLRLAEQPVNICRDQGDSRYIDYVDFVNSWKNNSK